MHGKLKIGNCILAVISSALQAFGLYHIHAMSGVTEGGVLGLNLLLEYWFGISPAITNFAASAICYFVGWRLLGQTFILYSAVAVGSFSAAYAVIEQFPPLWPQLYEMPLLASVLGAVVIGVTAGVCVRAGGAMCGDDALAMSISSKTGLPIERVYLITDGVVLALSASYIPLGRLAYSVLTVLLSGQIIGLVQRIPLREKTGEKS